jgi:hypothetical protein
MVPELLSTDPVRIELGGDGRYRADRLMYEPRNRRGFRFRSSCRRWVRRRHLKQQADYARRRKEIV